jgi:hypothetical protein
MRTDGNGMGPSEPRTATGALAWYRVDDLNAEQVAAMHSLDDARRAGLITEQDFREIEGVIRRGHVHGARKRITEAKRRHAAG